MDIRVDLPSYSCSFVVQVKPSSSVVDVKREIFRTCPGRPRPDGQRLIWRGRVLSDDENIDNLWKVCFPCFYRDECVDKISCRLNPGLCISQSIPPLGHRCPQRFHSPNLNRLLPHTSHHTLILFFRVRLPTTFPRRRPPHFATPWSSSNTSIKWPCLSCRSPFHHQMN